MATAEADPAVLSDSTEQASNSATTPNASAKASARDHAPVLTTFRSPDGAIATLTFRTPDGVTISDSEPLMIHTKSGKLVASLHSGPARFSDPDGTVVDQATYLLSQQDFLTLAKARVSDVSVRVHDGTDYVAYPYISGDLVE